MAKILVTGGAGYIGSHIVQMLKQRGADLLVVDDLSQGHRAAIANVPLVESDFADTIMLERELAGGRVEFIVHMAAFCEVGQSVIDPASYYDNNLSKSLVLLEQARRHGVRGIVFSSTAAVYGEPRSVPITEEHPQQPTNPYGETKLAFERALSWYRNAHDLRYVALRYFNAAGADPEGRLGEDHDPESHLIPRALDATLEGGAALSIFGDDYDTPDGTCIRDYVHVVDLAQAHVLALDALRAGEVEAESLNLGNGVGFSVRQVVDHVEQVTGAQAVTRVAPRREGDPARLVASSDRIRRLLGWAPAFPSLEQIIETAWRWRRTHPTGYTED